MAVNAPYVAIQFDWPLTEGSPRAMSQDMLEQMLSDIKARGLILFHASDYNGYPNEIRGQLPTFFHSYAKQIGSYAISNGEMTLYSEAGGDYAKGRQQSLKYLEELENIAKTRGFAVGYDSGDPRFGQLELIAGWADRLNLGE